MTKAADMAFSSSVAHAMVTTAVISVAATIIVAFIWPRSQPRPKGKSRMNKTNPISQRNQYECRDGHRCEHHEADHEHGPGCRHERVRHGDHVDYVVRGHVHHPHGDHCDHHPLA